MTDAAGLFEFGRIGADVFSLSFAQNGFVRQDYGQRSFPGRGTPLELAPGQSATNIVMRLTPTGTITGRILDGDKRPLTNVPVRLVRYDGSATTPLEIEASATTNDRGEYRLFFLTPGRYYLNAGGERAPTDDPFSGVAGLRQPQARHACRFYPGAADVQTATPIDLQPGVTLNVVDMTLTRQPLYTIRGRIIDSTTGGPPEFLQSINLRYDRCAEEHSEYSPLIPSALFEFRRMAPGTYGLMVSIRRNDESTEAYTPIEVRDSDISDVTVVVPPPTSLAGRWSVDEASGNGPVDTKPQAISLTPVRSFGGKAVTLWEPAERIPLNDDGTIGARMSGAPGEYRLSLKMDGGWYIKEAWYGAHDVLNGTIRLPGMSSEKLELRLGRSDAKVSGVVTDEQGNPVPVIEVVLIPENRASPVQVERTTDTNSQGRFTIANIVPGDYRVSARVALKPYAYSDAELVEKNDRGGTLIRISERTNLVVQVKALMPSSR
jgi:hypothetical protein